MVDVWRQSTTLVLCTTFPKHTSGGRRHDPSRDSHDSQTGRPDAKGNPPRVSKDSIWLVKKGEAGTGRGESLTTLDRPDLPRIHVFRADERLNTVNWRPASPVSGLLGVDWYSDPSGATGARNGCQGFTSWGDKPFCREGRGLWGCGYTKRRASAWLALPVPHSAKKVAGRIGRPNPHVMAGES